MTHKTNNVFVFTAWRPLTISVSSFISRHQKILSASRSYHHFSSAKSSLVKSGPIKWTPVRQILLTCWYLKFSFKTNKEADDKDLTFTAPLHLSYCIVSCSVIRSTALTAMVGRYLVLTYSNAEFIYIARTKYIF